MLAIRRPRLAFAVRFEENNVFGTIGRSVWYDWMLNAKKNMPFLSIEGITSEHRSNKKYNPIVELGNLALCEVKKENRNLICVGVSNEYDISFEKDSDILLGGICPRIPIYNLNNPGDLNKILNKLSAYVAEEYPLQTQLSYAAHQAGKVVQSTNRVVFHSNFIKVGDTRVNRPAAVCNCNRKTTMFPGNLLNFATIGTQQTKVQQKVTMPGIDPMGLLARLLK